MAATALIVATDVSMEFSHFNPLHMHLGMRGIRKCETVTGMGGGLNESR